MHAILTWLSIFLIIIIRMTVSGVYFTHFQHQFNFCNFSHFPLTNSKIIVKFIVRITRMQIISSPRRTMRTISIPKRKSSSTRNLRPRWTFHDKQQMRHSTEMQQKCFSQIKVVAVGSKIMTNNLTASKNIINPVTLRPRQHRLSRHKMSTSRP